jgi:HSP20 family protein
MKVLRRPLDIVGPWADWTFDIDRLFDHLRGDGRLGAPGFVPRTNVLDGQREFLVTMELPGVARDDVKVEVVEGRLVVSGEKRLADVAEDETLVCSERLQGPFKRTIDLPDQVDFEKVSATFRDGLLEITIPKSQRVLPRKIEVKLGG